MPVGFPCLWSSTSFSRVDSAVKVQCAHLKKDGSEPVVTRMGGRGGGGVRKMREMKNVKTSADPWPKPPFLQSLKYSWKRRIIP